MRNPGSRPISVSVALWLLAAAVLLRLPLWLFATNWTTVATYTSFLYLGPLTFFLCWAIYRRQNWGRWVGVVLYVPHVLSWTRAMLIRGYSAREIVLMSFLLLLQTVGALLLFLPASNAWFQARDTAANNVLEVTAG